MKATDPSTSRGVIVTVKGKMVRAPCCEKMGLKKGSWSPEEDLILINHINTHGHQNWRALPRQAGLLRCGKSCRLRWINYLRPDIKRGNFTREEEDMIIQLHEMLGNRWSAIAARLPGRTDNEIKNMWHTYLKKRLPQQQNAKTLNTKPKQNHSSLDTQNSKQKQQQPMSQYHLTKTETKEEKPLNSPQFLSSEVSTLTTTTSDDNSSAVNHHHHAPMNKSVDSLDDDFWTQVLSAGKSDDITSFSDREFKFSSSVYNNVDSWYDAYMGALELPGF